MQQTRHSRIVLISACIVGAHLIFFLFVFLLLPLHFVIRPTYRIHLGIDVVLLSLEIVVGIKANQWGGGTNVGKRVITSTLESVPVVSSTLPTTAAATATNTILASHPPLPFTPPFTLTPSSASISHRLHVGWINVGGRGGG
jgi:hypothetical protein